MCEHGRENKRHPVYALLWLYKRSLSPAFQIWGAQCRHVPTCSEYGAGCVARHGLWVGGWMTLARLIRCRPGGSRGYDPIPEQQPDVPAYLPWRYGDWAGGDRPFPHDKA